MGDNKNNSDQYEKRIDGVRSGRPKVNPDYNPVAARNKMANAVANIYLNPNSNMATDDEGHATMKELQLYFGLTMTKIRKLLVTAGVYHFYKDGVDMVEAVQILKEQGLSLEQIKSKLHISTGTANSFLPYKSGTYNADFTADDYDFSNVSTEARRKRNQRKREKMKDKVNIEKRQKEITAMEDKRTFMDRYNEQKKKEKAQSRKDAQKWLEDRGLSERWGLHKKIADGVAAGTLKVTDIPGVKENMSEDKIKEMEKEAVVNLLQYAMFLQDYSEPDDAVEEPDVNVMGEKFKSSRYVHGKPVGDYIFLPKNGEFYLKNSAPFGDDRDIIKAGAGMVGVIDENRCPHMFLFQYGDLGINVSVMLMEIYKCHKNGKLFKGQPDTEYEISVMGPREEKLNLMREVTEKTVVTLQNLTVKKERSRGLDPDHQLVKDGYYYSAKTVGSIKVMDDYNGVIYFEIDGRRYEAQEAVKLFATYCGGVMHYQMGDRTDDVLESDMTLMPMRIDEDALASELKDLLFALSEKHRGDFISYKDVAAFDVLFGKLMDKLRFYYRANPRKIGKGAGDKLIKILKGVGTDDDMFPEFEIEMVQDAVRDLWDRDPRLAVTKIKRTDQLAHTQKKLNTVFTLGYVTDNDEAVKLYESLNIPYKLVKGEVRAMTGRGNDSYEFRKAVDTMLRRIGADWMLDHMDVCVTEDGEFVFIASPYADEVDEKLIEKARRRGYEIVDSGFKPYAHEHAIVVRKI